MSTRDTAIKLLEIYGKAWKTRNPELVGTIFAEDATYNDPKEAISSGREAIKEYWRHKVIGEEDDIKFELLNLWVDAETAIAEWHATFKDTKRNLHIDMNEVAILTIKDGLINSLREYYKSVKTPNGNY
jgi:ketosteroid isomerase-like protein